VATLALVWYSSYHLARTEAAQPLAFAFGGEADPVDYARAIADGAVLALIATLGLLQLGHETTPELAQLASVSLYLYALSATPFRGWAPRAAVLVALPALAASGAPTVALALGLVGIVESATSDHPPARRFVGWIAAGTALAATAAWLLGAWGWRVNGYDTPAEVVALGKLLAWFMWPAWLLGLWTLWRWRAHWRQRHITVPLGCVLVSLGRMHRDGWVGPRPDARPAAAGRTRLVCLADTAAQHGRRNRLVLGVLLQRLRAGDLGHLRVVADRRSAPAGGQRRPPRAGLRVELLVR
jgi:hypothetical protein